MPPKGYKKKKIETADVPLNESPTVPSEEGSEPQVPPVDVPQELPPVPDNVPEEPLDPVPEEVTVPVPAVEGPEVSLDTQAENAEPIRNARQELADLEQTLSIKVKELQESAEEKQERCETIRLGATRLLQNVQSVLFKLGETVDAWKLDYLVFLKEKGGVQKSKEYLDDLSVKVSQQQQVFVRAKDITPVQFERLLALCNLPEEKFQNLLS